MPAELTRSDVEALTGLSLLEFGTRWCPICQAAQPLIGRMLAVHPELQHLKVEDGRGLPLGRSFGVKLWPTLVFLRAGQEFARVVRPRAPSDFEAALSALDAATQPPM